MTDAPPPEQLPTGPLTLAGMEPARSRAEQLAEALDQQVRSMRLAPGSLLGTLEQVRAETGLARATVSEAVRLLRERGVLEIRPGRGGGLFVADPSPVVRLRQTLLSVPEAPTAVADAVELRQHLELLVDVGAARCRSDEDVAELRAHLRAMASAGGWDGFVRANWELHERIAAISPNAMARAVYTGTLGHLTSARLHLDASTDDAYRAERLRVHEDLVEAIAAGDEDAVRRAVARHDSPA